MNPSSRRVLQALNQRALGVVRAVGRAAPVDLRKRALNLKPASVTWHIPNHRIAFVSVPKVATTSVRTSLAAFVTAQGFVDTDEVERHAAAALDPYARHLYPSEIRKLGRDCFTFAFVRNPLERLVSAYTRQGGFRRHGISRDISFSDFVAVVAGISDQRCDRHIRSQHRFITDRDGIVVTHVGRFERLEAEWADLMDRFGLPPLPKRNVSVHAPYEDAYVPRSARIAAERYRRDIELFGYEEDVARLL